jgi:hypothetical protein
MALTAIDFDNDGLRDLLWRNYSNGANVAWILDGNTKTDDLAIVPIGDVDWRIVGAADIDGDGISNLFWRYTGANATLRGVNLIWGNLNNSAPATGLQQISDLNWRVESVVDLGFDANGRTSTAMVWRNYATGQNLAWFLADGVRSGPDKSLQSVGDLNWEIAAVDDFNQDNAPDLVWRNNATGQNLIWHLDKNFNRLYDSALDPVADVNWRIEGAGDFSGDDQADLLWRNRATGQTLVWQMTTLAPVRYDITPKPGLVGSDWKMVSGSADFNGDGNFDLLWWNRNSGVLLSWYLNENGTYIGEGRLASGAPLESQGWQPITASASGVDGESSIFWQNRSSGETLFWQMDKLSQIANVFLPTTPSGWFVEDAIFVEPSQIFEGGGLYVLRNYSNGADRGKIQLRGLDEQGQVSGAAISLPTLTDLAWRIADVDDYNGDEYVDLLWRNYQTGDVGIWLFKNEAYTDYQWLPLPRVADVNWELVDAAPLVGSGGNSDFLWRNAATGQTVIWQMDGATKLGDLAIGTVPASSGWSVL